MMVTDSHDELMSMFTYAICRISKIYQENKKRINMQEYQKLCGVEKDERRN